MDRGTNTLSDEGSSAGGVNPHVFCLQGKTLSEALAECRTAKERLRLLPQFASLCDALGAAHSRGIIHRGLHPGVVLLSDYGETVISDWALSKTRGRPDPQRDKFGETVGSADMRPYLAPEISQGSVDEVDARSDVYALGAILHELLTGNAPSDAGPDDQAAAADPDVPRELVQVCRRAMFREASARYANASQLADSIRQVEAQAEHPAPAGPAGVDPLYRTLLGTAVLCLIVLAAGFGFLYHSLSADRAEAVLIRDKEIELRRNAEDARDKLAGELKDADTIRTRVENDRDRFEDELSAARSELDQIQGELRDTKEELITAHGAVKRAENIARLTAAPQPGLSEKAEPEGEQVKEEGPPEPFSTPLPDIDLLPEEPAEAAAPEEPSPAAPAESAPAAATPEPAPKPAEVEKPDFLKAMPDLIACLVTVEGAESQAALRITDATPPAVKAMRFRNGDYIVTRINQNPIKTVDDARRALGNVQHDSGFSIRVTRPDGLTTWMRINFTQPPEPAATPPAQPAPAAVEPAAPPAGEAEPPADTPQPAPPQQ